MNSETQTAFLNKRTKTKIIGLGLLLGVSIGVLGFFLLSHLFNWNNVTNKSEDIDLGKTQNPSTSGIVINNSDYVNTIQVALGLTDGPDDLLEEFNPSDLRGIADLIFRAEQFEETIPTQTLRELVIAELVRFDPEVTLGIVEHLPPSEWSDTVSVIFSTWSSTDIEAALKATEQLSGNLRKVAVRAILRVKPDQLALIKKVASNQDVTHHLDEILQENAALEMLSSQPREAWRLITQDTVSNYLQEDLLHEILGVWMYQKGYSILDEIAASRHRFELFQLDAILVDVLQSRPDEAFQHVVSLPTEQKNWLLPIVFKAWARRDPQSAYDALGDVDRFDKTAIKRTIFREWSKVDPSGLMEQLDTFGRTYRSFAATVAISQLASQDPQFVQDQLPLWSEIPWVADNELKRAFVQSWARQSPEDAYRWLQENESEDNQEYAFMLDSVLSNLADDDPQRALEIALSQPETSRYLKEGWIFLDRLISAISLKGQVDLIIANFDKIPKNSQRSTVNTVARHLIEANRWDDAMQITEKMSDDLQKYYFGRFASHGSTHNVSELIDRLDSLPSDEVRLIVVQRTLASNEFARDVLTEQQLQHLQSLKDQLSESN
ncbi:MAG: hypothetical protein OXG88_04105 [Gammaproteobacteria bacterium]|nr:hypothetical protein [Gammaproteobacteria bacterium]